jgi:nicotinate dehydrogenase subunit B
MTDVVPLRRELLKRSGVLAVVTPRVGAGTAAGKDDALDIYVCLTDDGDIYAFNGHVDLGTGVRTALAQIVAEELDVSLNDVTMVLGSTHDVPNQGPTVASETIQITAEPLRIAAAQVRTQLVQLAAAALDCSVDLLIVDDGIISVSGAPDRFVSYANLLRNRRIHAPLDRTVVPKAVTDHRLVGRSVGRVDIPAKVVGSFKYVHDVRVPSMLHGRVVRPPYSGVDAGEFIGRCLESVDRQSIEDIPGIVAVVVEGDFVGVVAEREEYANEAAERLLVYWKPWTFGHDLGDLKHALRTQHSFSRKLVDRGNVDAALSQARKRLDRAYLWPYQMHASIGPSCGVADVREDRATVWTGSQNPHLLRADLALLTGLSEEMIEVIRLEAAGCYGRNCADDVVADAALLSRAVRRPVRVQLTRAQEHLWEPKGSGQLIEVSGALGSGGSLAAYDFQSRYPTNFSPTLALLLTGRMAAVPEVLPLGDRSAVPSYNYENLRITVHDMAPIVRASWFRGVSALPNVFAHECFIDELAEEASADPLEFRLRHMNDPRAAELTKATAERAGWERRVGPRPQEEDTDIVRGRGIAQARYVHGNWPGTGAAWSAWVAEVAVNRATGEVNVTRVVAGQDTGLMINPAGVMHQLHGNVVQATSRVLKEEVRFTETTAVAAREWGAYPILTFPELPAIDVVMMDRRHEPPMGAGESASIPSAAAIVNAIYDATGVRFRELPLTPERVLAGLGKPITSVKRQKSRRLPSLGALAATLAGLFGFATVAFPIHSAIDPIARPDPTTYSASTIIKGRVLAALGACAVCHTQPGGETFAGGLSIRTPFGTVIATNITPDIETGIGSWSFPAFARAMREGVHRDGRHLYPAFPYPSFAKVSEEDLQALYAYLMAQPAVRQTNAPSTLVFPFNIRPLMAVWNFLFHRPILQAFDSTRSREWNRGRYLVDGLGHCGACHTPRNALGAERVGAGYLAGGLAEGWDAPALTRLSRAPLPWSEEALFAYLRTGASVEHGAAVGPMVPVVKELNALPDSDIRAIAIYLASLNDPLPQVDIDVRRQQIIERTASTTHYADSQTARFYQNACAVCHEAGWSALTVNLGSPLGLNSHLHASRPDNFLRIVINGTIHPSQGAMPSFRHSIDDRQLADLARYARARFAPTQAPWPEIEATITRLRATQ